MAFSKEHWQRERRALGLCVDCGEPAADRLCSGCREKHVGSAKASASARVRAGLCRQCGEPNPQGGFRCFSCLKQERSKYRSRVEAGLCVYCGVPSVAGAFCLHHWFKNIGSQYGLNKKNGGIDLLKKLWEEQGSLCAVTGRELIPGVNASLDHILPRSRGGLSTKENLRWVLEKINRMKWDLTHSEFVEMCREVIHVHDQKTERSN